MIFIYLSDRVMDFFSDPPTESIEDRVMEFFSDLSTEIIEEILNHVSYDDLLKLSR